MSLFDKRCVFLITGASRGYGRAVALALASELSRGQLQGDGSLIVGSSRSSERLDKLKEDIAAVCPNLKCTTSCVDLGNIDTMAEAFSSFVKFAGSFDAAAIVHNAGDAGDLSISCAQQADARQFQATLDLNVNGMIQLNGAFLRQFEAAATELFVVNISTLLAIDAWPGFHMYSVTKAARDMYVKVLAKEMPSVRCLNWAPGPMPTDVFMDIQKHAWSTDVRDMFTKMLTEKSHVTCESSAAKFMGVLKENKFESGAHIDYYDV